MKKDITGGTTMTNKTKLMTALLALVLLGTTGISFADEAGSTAAAPAKTAAVSKKASHKAKKSVKRSKKSSKAVAASPAAASTSSPQK